MKHAIEDQIAILCIHRPADLIGSPYFERSSKGTNASSVNVWLDRTNRSTKPSTRKSTDQVCLRLIAPGPTFRVLSDTRTLGPPTLLGRLSSRNTAIGRPL